MTSAPTTLLPVGAALAFCAGVTIVVATVLLSSLGRARVARGLSTIDTVYGGSGRRAPVVERDTPQPVANRMTKLGRAATPGVALTRLRRWLDLAGNPPYWTVDRVF